MNFIDTLRGGPEDPARLPQLFATLSASVGGMVIGAVIGYSSPAGYKLRQHNITNNTNEIYHLFTEQQNNYTNSSIDFTENSSLAVYGNPLYLNSNELAWFSSLVNIGGLFGGFLSSPMMQNMGRRGTMIASTVISIVGWLLIGFGSDFSMITSGRVITGVAAGIASVTVNAYIGEVASKDIRGILGSSFQTMIAIGILFVYVCGWFTTWYTLALLSCAPSVLFAFLMFFNVESPAYLIARGKDEQAYESLRLLRGPNYDTSDEFASTKQSYEEASRKKISLSDFKDPTVYKPLGISLTLIAFLQLSGIDALDFNLASIFKSAGSKLSDYGSTVICGTVECISSVVTVIFVETAGRKSLLIKSALIMAVSQGCIGMFFVIKEIDEELAHQYLAWIPLIGIIVFMIAFGAGIGTVPWIMLGEMFPPRVRETAGALTVAVYWIASFLVVFTFEHLQNVMPLYAPYLIFAGINFLAAIFSSTVVIETKGKSLQEVTEMFRDKTEESQRILQMDADNYSKNLG